MVIAYDLELVDPTKVWLMMFGRDGSVAVTAGQKGGPLTGPLMEWKIVDGRLRITDEKGNIDDELTLLSRQSTKVIVRLRSGEVVTFKLRPSRSA